MTGSRPTPRTRSTWPGCCAWTRSPRWRSPPSDQEAARDLVRAREDARGDLMRARHRLSKLLLRQGIVYSGGKAWTGTHDAWLRHAGASPRHAPATRLTFESDYDAVLTVKARRDRLDARSSRWPRTASSPRWCAGWDACVGSAP